MRAESAVVRAEPTEVRARDRFEREPVIFRHHAARGRDQLLDRLEVVCGDGGPRAVLLDHRQHAFVLVVGVEGGAPPTAHPGWVIRYKGEWRTARNHRPSAGTLRRMDPAAQDQSTTQRADPRYQRLMQATREAAQHGYEAVSMRELAEACRLSMTTIYQFCQSKDHLIAEAHLEGLEQFRQRVVDRPPKGATAEERVRRVMQSYAMALEVDEAVSRTLLRAMYSLDPHVTEARVTVGDTYRDILAVAIGDEALTDRDAKVNALGHVIDSVIVGWLSGRYDAIRVRGELESAVHVLLSRSRSSTPAPPPRTPRKVPAKARRS